MILKNKNPIILAIDYGTQRIGLAISRVGLAEPLTILANQPGVLAQLAQLCQREQVTQLVVGMSENQMAEKTKHFVAELRQYLQQHADLELAALPITFIDETLSSQLVHQKLIEAGVKKSKRQQPIDHYAAACILDEWLSFMLH